MLRGLLHFSQRTLRLIWSGVNLFVMFFMAFSAYCGYISPERFVLAQTINLSFPIWMVLGLILLVVNLMVWRRMSLAWAVAFILCSGPILTVSPLNLPLSKDKIVADSDSDSIFTLMTYNAYMFRDFDDYNATESSPTLQYIIDKDVDIVCLQESSNLFLTPNGTFVWQRYKILDMYPYLTHGEFDGDFVLSKFPIRNITPEQPAWDSGGYLAYEVDVHGHKLILINTHFQSFAFKSDERQRYQGLPGELKDSPRAELSFVKRTLLAKMNIAFRLHAEQARHLVAFVDSIAPDPEVPVIIAGDFNDVAGSYAYRLLRNRLHLSDAYADVAFGPTITYNRNRFYFHIDQILYRGGMTVLDIERGDVKSSDHYPLTATFMWNFQ